MKESYRSSAGPTRRAVRWLANYGPIGLPILACAAVFGLMRADSPAAQWRVWDVSPDAGGAPWNVFPTFKWLVYDECDVGAYALRGANATVGRLPGRRDEPPRQEPEELAIALDGNQPSLAPRFYLEYPTPTLALFRLGYVLNPGAKPLLLPPALADAHHNGLAYFAPRSDVERDLWSAFRFAYRVHYVVMATALVALVLVLRWGYEPGRSLGPVWLCALPGAVFFSLNRFDILPALATAFAFSCLGRKKTAWAGAFLGAGVLIKLYPVLFVPLVLRYLGLRRTKPFILAFVGTIAAGFGWCLWATDWEGTVGPILVQLTRPYEETSWTLYGRVLPEWLARHGEVRLAILALVEIALVLRRPRDLDDVLRRCGLVLIPFVAMAVFWSPQWLVWFLPMIVPLARQRPWLIGFAVLNDLLNYFNFPILFWLVWHQFPRDVSIAIGEISIYVRAAIWIGLAVLFLRNGRKDPLAEFRATLLQRIEEFLAAIPARGLKLTSATAVGEVLFVRDVNSDRPTALVPLSAEVEPAEGAGLEDVPAARIPRPVTAVFEYANGTWKPTGRALFNLGPAEVVVRSNGRYGPFETPDPSRNR